MSRICLCLTGKTLDRDLEILTAYRKYADLAELRVDCLDSDERLYARRFPAMAGLPVILTIRRDEDGGFYTGGEAGRIILMTRALAFAETDRRNNFAYVDMEDDLRIPCLEEAVATFGTRIIRSFHDTKGTPPDLAARLRGMARPNELVKAAVTARTIDDVLVLWRAAAATEDIEKILLCMGPLGFHTRVLASRLGSFLTYSSPQGESGAPSAAPGQIGPRDMAEHYRFKSITKRTKVFGVTGYPLSATDSPWFFNSVFGLENLNAVYLPFPSNSIEGFLTLAAEIGLAGASVTVPHKETVLPFLSYRSPEVEGIGACNTLVLGQGGAGGWRGFNTDAPGFSASLLNFLGKKNLKRLGVTIVGAGGAARAVAAEVKRLGGRGLILNRTPARARELAALYGFAWGPADQRGADMIKRRGDVIIQTTSVGMSPYAGGDPLPCYDFSGKEAVMDLIYKPPQTHFLKRAAAAGCRTLNGYDMLLRQARCQYTLFLNKEFPAFLADREFPAQASE